MIRKQCWETALSDYLAANGEAVFAWGEKDCALFVADALLAMTGDDIAAPFRGKYKTAGGSVRALRREGYLDAWSVFDAHLSEIPPAFAQRGDVAMYSGAMGICIGRTALFLTEDEGLTARPMIEWTRCWRVPFAE